MEELLSIQDIHVSYGKTEIVKGISLSIAGGELCTLLGLNGSGKTTLLRGVCGLNEASGKCIISGKDTAGMNEHERARYISFIPQVSSPYHGKSVMDVLLMGANPYLGLLESPREEHRIKAREALAKLNISDFEDRMYNQLSQGQKQMIILARTLVQDTPVMLMDEPDSALDFLRRHRVLNRIRDLVKSENKACLITLHDPNFAIQYSDRIFLVDDGLLIDELDMRTASTDEVKEKLGKIYSEIELVQYSGGYLLGKPANRSQHS